MGMLKSLQQDALQVQIFETRTEMGTAAGQAIAARMRELLAKKTEINMIFAAAPSQNETLAALIAEKGIDWNRVNAFHMDEYVGLPAAAPQSFGNFLKEKLFDLVPFKSVHLIGTAGDEQTVAQYTAALRAYPTDIVVLGIGENGHIAFNDPWEAHFDDPAVIKRVRLDEICRQQQVNDGCFATLADVPHEALTLTVPTLFAGDYLYCTVPAATKAEAVYQTVHHAVSEEVPATVMRKHAHAFMYCDKESGEKLL